MRVLVFDLDGTLVDTMGIYEEKASELMLRFYGISKPAAKRLYRATSGLPFLHQLNLLFPRHAGVNLKVARFFESWKEKALRDVKVSEEIRNTLRELKDKGFVLAVSSNNLQEYVERIVEGCPFDVVLGWDWRGFTKGEPHLSFLEEKLGIPRREFLFLGDSSKDEEIARSCGVEFFRTCVASLPKDIRKLLTRVPAR